MNHSDSIQFPLDKIGVNISHCAGGHLDAGGEDVSPTGTTEISNSCSLTLLNTNYNENETQKNFTPAKKNCNKNENLQNIIQISIQNGSLQECSYLKNQLALLSIDNLSDENIVEDVRPRLVMENGRPISPTTQKNNEFSPLQYEDLYMSSLNNIDEIWNESKLLKTSSAATDDTLNVSSSSSINEGSLYSKKKIVVNDNINILCQNVRSINDSFKKDYFYHYMNSQKIDILILTETWECESLKYGIERSFPHCKTIKSCGDITNYKGRGIAAIITYPLAQHIISYRSLHGRVLRIIFKHKKKNELSLWAVQAPTAPYGGGQKETLQLNEIINQMLNEDFLKRRRVIICGDINSYPSRIIDYCGTCSGQEPSKLVENFEAHGLIDVYRNFNPNKAEFTFKSNTVLSRLDHFWVSPQLMSSIRKSEILSFNELISDHAAISLRLFWQHKRLYSNKQKKTAWNNNDELKIEKWSHDAQYYCDRNLKPDIILTKKEFKKKFSQLAKYFCKLSRKYFWIKKRGKRNEKPPIWLYAMRKLRKAERLKSDKALAKLQENLKKYFSAIDINLDFASIRIELKKAAQILLHQKAHKQVKSAIESRFYTFSENISMHLDNILERNATSIDTGFIKNGEEIICEPSIVKREFFNYYKKLFGNEDLPAVAIDEPWEENYDIMGYVELAELQIALNNSARNKAAGISGITMEMLKYGGTTLLQWIQKQFNSWLDNSEIPSCLLQSQIWLIPKGQYTGDITNTRPINLIEALRKLFSTIQ